jgi:aspartyl/asparaginyl beta-hydroxylase (cupin superfamily)
MDNNITDMTNITATDKMYSIVLFVTIVALMLMTLWWWWNKWRQCSSLQDNLFYKVNDTYPHLRSIHPLRPKIMKELQQSVNWIDWPEKNLYANTGTWKIFPLYAFGIWAQDNCNKLPILTKFVKKIPNLKTAIISKLSPKMKLTPHQGWGEHSNNVLRAHYGLIVPENACYIGVSDKNRNEKEYHKDDEWLVFDDSKMHMAENTSDQDRIVLILDIVRPEWVKKGESTIKNTKELNDIVNAFKAKN